MNFAIRVATVRDAAAIAHLIRLSVCELQPQYTEGQREAALQTVFTLDSRLIADKTYFVAEVEGIMAGCGGWSFRKTLYGGDHQVEHSDAGVLDPAQDAAKIRAIFVHPQFARRGLGSRLLKAAEDAAFASGYERLEMGSTLAGIELYQLKGYVEEARHNVPVGGGESIIVVHMTKRRPPGGNVPPRSAEV